MATKPQKRSPNNSHNNKKKKGRPFTKEGLFRKYGFKIHTIDYYLWCQIQKPGRRPAHTEKRLQYIYVIENFWKDHTNEEYLLLVPSMRLFVRTGYHAGKDGVTKAVLDDWLRKNQPTLTEIQTVWKEQEKSTDEHTPS